MIYVFLATGFEEIEALFTVDVLRRAGLEIKTVAIGESRIVMGTHNIPVIADAHIDELDSTVPEAIILPGGMPGTRKLEACEALKATLEEAGIRVAFDNTDNSPGWKFNEWEMKGVPVRIEIGPRDIENNQAVVVRRDTLEKSFDEFKKSSEEFQKVTEDRLDDLDKRIESLENK